MSDILGKIFAGALLVIVIIFVPFTLYLQKTEAIKQAAVETVVVEFVDNCCAVGKISPESYEQMYANVSRYVEFADIQITHSSRVVGYDNGDVFNYFVDFNKNDILEVMYDSVPSENIDYRLRNGDALTVVVKNTKPTLASRLSLGRHPTTSIYYPYSNTVGNYSEKR